MSLRRIAAYVGAVFLILFVVTVIAYGEYGTGSWFIVAIVLVLLVVAGSRLYGRQSRYGVIAARKRPAQDAHDRAADVAADARRATAEAAKRGERYCPLDPANEAGHTTTTTTTHAATNGHPSAARQSAPPSPA